MQHTQTGVVSSEEVSKFDALAGQWWDPAGPMAPLHAMNPLRADWVDARIARAARILDVGCGAGLLSEALASRGHDVLGLDAAGGAINAARAQAGHQDGREAVGAKGDAAKPLGPVPRRVHGGDDGQQRLRGGGILADVAPTVLEVLGVDQPAQMTGQSLIEG